MGDLKSDFGALVELVAEMAKRLDTAPPAPAAEQKKVLSRSAVQAQVTKSLAKAMGGAVKTIKGQTVIERDGQRFKVIVSGPHARIRAPGRPEAKPEAAEAKPDSRPGAPRTGGAAAS